MRAEAHGAGAGGGRDADPTYDCRFACVMALLLMVVGTAGCLTSGGDASVDRESDAAPFTIVVLPDTQYYSSLHPEILEAQVQWILANLDQRQIALVVHEGDIVDADEPRQWAHAARSL